MKDLQILLAALKYHLRRFIKLFKSQDLIMDEKGNYHYDHFVCGRYLQTEVYTKEERRQNFIEEFGYAPCYL